MTEKKILIFEDEWNTIKGSFDLANAPVPFVPPIGLNGFLA